jgi:hypothetical protein
MIVVRYIFLLFFYITCKFKLRKNTVIYIFNNKVNQQIHYHQNDVSLLKYLLKKQVIRIDNHFSFFSFQRYMECANIFYFCYDRKIFIVNRIISPILKERKTK